MENVTTTTVNQLLILFSIILISGMLFSKIGEIIHLPDVVMFILSGILLGPHVLNVISIDQYPTINQFILTFGAAYILYDGGREIHLRVLNEVKISVTLLSTLGVLLSTVIICFFSMKILHFNFIYGLLLGAVISSTDPSVLIPLFKNMRISNKLKQTIIAESAFNDAIAAVITSSLINIIINNKFSLNQSIAGFFVSACGGILIGIVIGLIASSLKSDWTHGIFRRFPSAVSLVSVTSAYAAASYLGASGFMAVFVVGIICGNKHLLGLTLNEEYIIEHEKFKDVLIMILRVLIFTILGTQINLLELSKNWINALLIVLVLIFIARPVSVLFSVIFDRKAKWKFKEVIYLMWVRETGIIPAALASMLLSMKIEHAGIISSITSMAIIITLTLQVSTSSSLAKHLKLDKN